MVNDDAQLYTIEGVAAGILMIFTAYLVINSTYVLTPGDTHINDMQLEQLGNDVLRSMDTSPSYNPDGSTPYLKKLSLLEEYVLYPNPPSTMDPANAMNGFVSKFGEYAGMNDNRIKVKATISYRKEGNNLFFTYPLPLDPSTEKMTGREHYVRVARWVHLSDNPPLPLDQRSQTVLLEVLLWRD